MTFARQTITPEAREDEREARRAVLCQPSRALLKGSYAGTTAQAIAKPTARRNPALLEMARGRVCLLCPPGQCACTPGSVVACHSNLGEHGKAKSRKADDCYTVWGGDFIHRWLDQGGATKEEKRSVFLAALARQVGEWSKVTLDESEPARYRKAAAWALEALNSDGISMRQALEKERE